MPTQDIPKMARSKMRQEGRQAEEGNFDLMRSKPAIAHVSDSNTMELLLETSC